MTVALLLRMKFLFLTAGLLLTALLTAQVDTLTPPATDALSAVDTTVFPFVAYWSVGDVFHYEVTKIANETVDGDTTKTDTISYQSTLEVIDSTDDGYLLKYTIGEYTSNNPAGLSVEALSALGKFQHLEGITYRTDELGAFVGLENWQDFALAFDTLFEITMRELVAKEKVADEAALRRAMEPLRTLYTSEAGILDKVVGELQYLHFPFGVQFVVGDTAYYNEGFNNLIGDKPIVMENTLYIEEANWSEDYVELRHFTRLTPDGAATLLDNVTKTMPGVTDTPEVEAGLVGAGITIEDDNWYAFYNYPGIPIMIDNDRYFTIDIAGESRTKHNKIIIRWTD